MVAELQPPPNLNDLGDVNVPTPGDGNVLYWDDVAGKWQCRALVDGDIPAGIARDAEVIAAVAAEAAARAAAIAAVELDDLADVNVPTPGDGEALVWDDATSKWIPGAGVAFECADLAACALNALGDVNAPAPADGEALIWNAATSKWIATAVAGSKIQDADGDTYVWVEKTADEDKVHIVTKGVECGLFHDNGILDLVKQSSAGIDSNAGQTIPDNTWTFLTYNIKQYDVQGEVDLTNNWIKVKTAGTYLVAMSNVIYGFPAPYLLASQVYGSVHGELAYDNLMSSATDNLRVTPVGICSLSANEEVRGRLYQHTGVNQSLSTYTGQNWLRVYKLG